MFAPCKFCARTPWGPTLKCYPNFQTEQFQPLVIFFLTPLFLTGYNYIEAVSEERFGGAGASPRPERSRFPSAPVSVWLAGLVEPLEEGEQ